MIPQKVERQSVVSGVSESREFSVDLNSHLINTIITGIYSNKIGSPIRELMTNAYDAHREAGVDRPITVGMPQSLDPEFYVRDYGFSMTHEEVLDTYSVLARSSKRESNDVVGMLGYGSKSPFAYTDSFTVRCYQGGVVRTYGCSIGSNGVPSIHLLNTSTTSDDDGTEVRFPVSPEDLRKFRDEFDRVSLGFDEGAIEVRGHQLPDLSRYLEGDGWYVQQNRQAGYGSQVYARQGCVLYPVDHSYINQYMSPSFRLVLDFPIGSLTPTDSRESLGYDKKTVENLKVAFAKLKEELKSRQVIEESRHSNLREANAASQGVDGDYSRLVKSFGLQRIWGGIHLESYSISSEDIYGNHLALDKHQHSFGTIRNAVSRPKKSKYLRYYVDFFFDAIDSLKHKLVWEPRETKNYSGRMRRVIRDTDPEVTARIIWMHDQSSDEIDQWCNKMGISRSKVLDLSTVEPLRVTRKVDSKSSEVKCRVFTSSNCNGTAEYRVITPGKDTVVIRLVDGEYDIGLGRRETANTLGCWYRQIDEHMPEEIAVINKTNEKFFKDKQVVNLADHIKSSALASFGGKQVVNGRTPRDVISVQQATEVSSPIIEDIRSLFGKLKFIPGYTAHILSKMGVDVKDSAVYEDDPRYVLFQERYPLMGVLPQSDLRDYAEFEDYRNQKKGN